jgi:hypothetical protein
MLIFPSDPMNARRPDQQFAREYVAAQELDIPVALIDHDEVERGRPTTSIKQTWSEPIVYRGWMCRSEHYAALTRAAPTAAQFVTSASAYQRAHELPGWYDTFAQFTPKTHWVERTTELPLNAEALERAALYFDGPLVIKDFVKSAKHYWDEACFVPNPHDFAQLRSVCERLIELRGDQFVGGIVLRAFEDFVGPEIRSWWINGELILMTPHPDLPEDIAVNIDLRAFDLASFSKSVHDLHCPFVTLDVVEDADGELRVVEVGDGQVSALHECVDPTLFVRMLAALA